MKKMLCIFWSVMLILSLTACSNSTQETPDDAPTEEETNSKKCFPSVLFRDTIRLGMKIKEKWRAMANETVESIGIGICSGLLYFFGMQ